LRVTDSTTSLPKVGFTKRPIGVGSSIGTFTYAAAIARAAAFSDLAVTRLWWEGECFFP
jgi:hypothetical protein